MVKLASNSGLTTKTLNKSAFSISFLLFLVRNKQKIAWFIYSDHGDKRREGLSCQVEDRNKDRHPGLSMKRYLHCLALPFVIRQLERLPVILQALLFKLLNLASSSVVIGVI
jgi:hypothetical protein